MRYLKVVVIFGMFSAALNEKIEAKQRKIERAISLKRQSAARNGIKICITLISSALSREL